MTVEIPSTLIQRLQGLGPHFCLVKARDKNPSIGGKGWQTPEKLLSADDSKLQEHLKRGGNYGVVGGFGLVIVDTDIQEMKQIVKEKLSPTFTVESPGSHGWHSYFLCGLEKPIRLRDKNKENIGDIQGPGKMVVGPNSIHPNGGIYKIVNNRPLAQITRQQLIEAFKDFVVPDREIQQVEATARMEKRETNINLDILQVVPLSGLHKRGREYFGPHPVHGSKTRQNFWVNPAKNCWHCFRHQSGGGPLLWLAVEEGIIGCSDAGPRALKGEVFKQVLKKAVERGYIKESQVNIQKNAETGTPVGNYWLKKKRNKAFLVDKDNKPVLSCNLDSMDGPRFKKKLREKTGLPEAEIDKATASFQFALQSIRKSHVNVEENDETKKEEFDEETTRRAWELLRDPAFFFKLGGVFQHGFIVSKLNKPRFIIGEERNKRLLGPLLIGASKLSMTSIIKLLGEIATAKDTMLRMWLDLLPIKSVERSYFTAAGLRYSQEMKNADLLYIPDSPELRGEMGRQMRFMRADDGGLISEYATRDAETGEMVTKVSRLPVKGIATTSNAVTGDAALESGMWTLKTNATEELTREVKEEKLKLRAGKKWLFPEDELKVWRCAFKILVSEELPDALPEVPFAEQLITLLGSGRSASRRDPDKLCDLISLIAWTRRFQKNVDERDETDLTDFYIALQIGLDAITETISELGEREERIFEAVKHRTVGEGQVNVTCRDVTAETKIPYRTCFRYLERLVDKGFLNKDKEGRKNVYSILSTSTPFKLAISEGLSSEKPDKIMELIHVENKEYPYPYGKVARSKRSEISISEAEKKPNELATTSMASLEKPDEVMKFILRLFRILPSCHGGSDIRLILIDPITGDEVTVTIKENGESDTHVEKNSYVTKKGTSLKGRTASYAELAKLGQDKNPLIPIGEETNNKPVAEGPIPLTEVAKPIDDDAIDKVFPPLTTTETLILLRSKWTRGTSKETQEQEFLDLIHQIRPDLSRKEAATLFAKLIEDGKMGYDPEGWLVWC